MKKAYLFILAFLLSFGTWAEIPKNFKVYTTGAGTTIPFCTKLLEEYNRLYNTNSILVIKPGASSLIAIREMANDKQFSILCYTGLGENVFNPRLYPEYKKDHDSLASIAAIINGPTLFYTRAKSPYKDLQDLINNKQDLAIGTHGPFGKAIADLVVKKSSKNVFVNYKSAKDAIPSLLDGTLDLYIDGGGLIPVVDSEILKSLGHFNAPKNAPWPDMSKHFPVAASFKGLTVISTNTNTSKEDILTFNQNLREVMKNEGILQEIKNIFSTPDFKSVEDTNKELELIKQKYNKLYDSKKSE